MDTIIIEDFDNRGSGQSLFYIAQTDIIVSFQNYEGFPGNYFPDNLLYSQLFWGDELILIVTKNIFTILNPEKWSKLKNTVR